MPEKLLLVISLQNCRLPNQAGSRTRRKSIGKDESGDSSFMHSLTTLVRRLICSAPLPATALTVLFSCANVPSALCREKRLA